MLPVRIAHLLSYITAEDFSVWTAQTSSNGDDTTKLVSNKSSKEILSLYRDSISNTLQHSLDSKNPTHSTTSHSHESPDPHYHKQKHSHLQSKRRTIKLPHQAEISHSNDNTISKFLREHSSSTLTPQRPGILPCYLCYLRIPSKVSLQSRRRKHHTTTAALSRTEPLKFPVVIPSLPSTHSFLPLFTNETAI